MSTDAVRLCIGISMLPLLMGFSWWSAATFDYFFPNTAPTWSVEVAQTLTAIIAVALWLLTWRGRIEWTPRRKRVTALLAGMLVGFSFVAARVVWLGSDYMGALLIGVAYPLWFAGTAFVWRSRRPAIDDELRVALAPEPRCPVCSYSLVGLREVRCPECGWSSTVDQVIEQAWRERVELMHGV